MFVCSLISLSPFLLTVDVAIVNVDPLATARSDGAATAQKAGGEEKEESGPIRGPPR